MNRRKSILVVTDFEGDAEQVVDKAIVVARQLDCVLDIVFCDAPNIGLIGTFSLSNEAEVWRKHIQETQEAFVASLAKHANDVGVPATGCVIDQRPISDGILARAKETNPYLLMKGTRYHSATERSLLVDTDWQLMRSCPFPLWLVKKNEVSANLTVVAAVDPIHEHDKPAELDQIIVDTAKAITFPASGSIHLLHTYERLEGIGVAVNRALNPVKLSVKEIDERMKTERGDALVSLANSNDVEQKMTHLIPGRTEDILPTFVRDHEVDVVVMGALARWSLKRAVIGSTAERVMDHLPCDVLIVRNNEYQIPAHIEQSDEAIRA